MADTGDQLIGMTIGGRYRVRELIGVGGSAAVYDGEDLTFGRTVALKIPHDNVGPNSLAAKRLLREARASGAVAHPNVCEISEIGALPNGTPFVVMERLTGETLRERITAETRLAFGDIVDVMMQILSGLDAAHERGITHRDVKPDNIFLSRRAGCPALVKILDFGLVAGDQHSNEELTAIGEAVGTPYYMAPEQIRGVRDFHPSVDLYACGVVLYEMTTGRRPFEATTTPELFKSVLNGVFVAVDELRSDTPQELAEVIHTAMAPSPKNRYASAAELQRALADVRVAPPTPFSLRPFRASPPLAVTRVEGPTDGESEVTIDVADPTDWDQQTIATTEWEQPTVKRPLSSPKKP